MDDQATVGGTKAQGNRERIRGYREVSTILLDARRHDQAEVIDLVNDVAKARGKTVQGTALFLLKIMAQRWLLERKQRSAHQPNGV